jgi:ribulose-phosphate 3-epimerase
MLRIAPSLLSADFARLAEEVGEVERAGADVLHLDVMDGLFVPNITFGPLVVEALRPHSRLIFDVHLMIERPERYVELFAKAGADWMSVHAEGAAHLHRTICQIKDLGVKAGVVINPATPAESLVPVLGDVDYILVMTVNPGFGGQKFIHSTLEKIRTLRRMLDERGLGGVPIEVDGGINGETAPLAVEAGAEVLVAGNSIFGRPDRAAAIREIRESCGMFGG